MKTQLVHLNSAEVGRMSAAVRTVLTAYARREEYHGPYELEEEFAEVLSTGIRERVADLLHASAADTVLAAGGGAVFENLVARLPLGPGDRVWSTPYESAGTLTALRALCDRTRCRLEVVPLDAVGDLDLAWMAAHLDQRVALVSITYVPSGCGIVNPIEEIGRLLAQHPCLYAVDATHAVGQLPVDVARIGCDLLTGDGWRFLCGPQGIGFAYTGERLREALAFADVEPWVRPQGAALVSLHAAMAEHAAATSLDEELFPRLLGAVEAVPGLTPIAPGRLQSGILTFHHPRLPAALIRRRLAEQGVIVWKIVAQQTPLLHLGEDVGTAVRVSLHHDTTPTDIDRFAEALDQVVWEELARVVSAPRSPRPAAAESVGGGRRLTLLPVS